MPCTAKAEEEEKVDEIRWPAARAIGSNGDDYKRRPTKSINERPVYYELADERRALAKQLMAVLTIHRSKETSFATNNGGRLKETRATDSTWSKYEG